MNKKTLKYLPLKDTIKRMQMGQELQVSSRVLA
jgi:hypothetical protein